jgi:sugar phosphate isomerase/epimerase
MITVYTVEGRDGKEDESFSTQDYEEAKAYARERGLRVIASEHEYDHASYDPEADDEDQRRRARAARVARAGGRRA